MPGGRFLFEFHERVVVPMPDVPQVILSGFGDEAAYHKTAVEQFSPLAALGLQYYSLRSIDAGRGIKNVLDLTTAEVQKIRHLEDEYDLSVSSIGSPIGKVKLARRRRWHDQQVCAVCPLLGPRSAPGMRAGPCVRDQTHSGLLVLSAPRRGSAKAFAPSRPPIGRDRRSVPPLRFDLWLGSGSQPGRPRRPFDWRKFTAR